MTSGVPSHAPCPTGGVSSLAISINISRNYINVSGIWKWHNDYIGRKKGEIIGHVVMNRNVHNMADLSRVFCEHIGW